MEKSHTRVCWYGASESLKAVPRLFWSAGRAAAADERLLLGVISCSRQRTLDYRPDYRVQCTNMICASI